MPSRNLPMIPAPLDTYARLGRYVSDSRTPTVYSLSARTRRFGTDEMNEQCPSGEHVWDVIESARQEVTYDTEDREIVTVSWWLVFTCLACGVCLEREGVATNPRGRRTRLNPVPLTAGRLSAQQCSSTEPFPREAGEWDSSAWLVYDGAGLVGSLSTARTPRGRRYVVGALGPEVRAEAPTPLACLRKLARLVSDAASRSSAC